MCLILYSAAVAIAGIQQVLRVMQKQESPSSATYILFRLATVAASRGVRIQAVRNVYTKADLIPGSPFTR